MTSGDYSNGGVCPSCSYNRATLLKEARRNEARMRAGQRPVLAAVDRAKKALRDCAASGHHDVHAGARAAHSTSLKENVSA